MASPPGTKQMEQPSGPLIRYNHVRLNSKIKLALESFSRNQELIDGISY